MSEINDGGPAFPRAEWESSEDDGMSLRDWFAGQALMGMVASPRAIVNPINPEIIIEQTAVNYSLKAYALADAMIQARGKT